MTTQPPPHQLTSRRPGTGIIGCFRRPRFVVEGQTKVAGGVEPSTTCGESAVVLELAFETSS